MLTPSSPEPASLHVLQITFVSEVLPRIETHAEVCSRGIRCPHSQEEFKADMVALAWKWFLRLIEKGKNPLEFPTAIATYAAKAVKSGRRLTGQERSKEVLSPVARHKHGVKVEPLPSSTRRDFEDFYGTVHGQQERVPTWSSASGRCAGRSEAGRAGPGLPHGERRHRPPHRL